MAAPKPLQALKHCLFPGWDGEQSVSAKRWGSIRTLAPTTAILVFVPYLLLWLVLVGYMGGKGWVNCHVIGDDYESGLYRLAVATSAVVSAFGAFLVMLGVTRFAASLWLWCIGQELPRGQAVRTGAWRAMGLLKLFAIAIGIRAANFAQNAEDTWTSNDWFNAIVLVALLLVTLAYVAVGVWKTLRTCTSDSTESP